MKMNKETLMPILKAGVALAGVGITLAQSYFSKKELDEAVTKKVAEALEQKTKES